MTTMKRLRQREVKEQGQGLTPGRLRQHLLLSRVSFLLLRDCRCVTWEVLRHHPHKHFAIHIFYILQLTQYTQMAGSQQSVLERTVYEGRYELSFPSYPIFQRRSACIGGQSRISVLSEGVRSLESVLTNPLKSSTCHPKASTYLPFNNS